MYEEHNNTTEPCAFYSASPQTEPPTPAPKKSGKGARTAAVLLLSLCFALIGGMVGAGSTVLYLQSDTSEPANTSDTSENSTAILEGSRESTVVDIHYVDTSKQMTAAEIYAINVNSTVGITTSITTNYFGYQTTSAASGSGFLLTSDGYIVTNYHVIEGANTVTVTMYDGTAYDAAIIGYDESNDIAVLKISAEGLTPVVLGDSDNLNVGDSVIAIGNPLGELTFSLTAGAVSALNREVTMSSGITMDLIQTDCAINSGNSGGALFNMYGEVIGITNAKYSGSGSSSEASIDNIGFAIPINHVRSLIESIIEKGYYSKPYIGVSVGDLSSSAQGFGLPDGAVVYSVTEDAPAAKAGLAANDIITAINGETITCADDLIAYVTACEAGDVLTLSVYRKGETLELSVTVEEQIQSVSADDNSQSGNGNSFFSPRN